MRTISVLNIDTLCSGVQPIINVASHTTLIFSRFDATVFLPTPAPEVVMSPTMRNTTELKIINNSPASITLRAASGNTIEGSLTYVLRPGSHISLQAYGTMWYLV